MKDAREKLLELRAEMVPVMLAQLASIPGGGMMAKFLAPQVEGWCDRAFADRSVDELDGALELAIAGLARLRSDTRGGLLITGDECWRLDELDAGPFSIAGDRVTVWLGDPVRGPHLRHGDDELGEVDAREVVDVERGGAPVGDRPD